MADHPVSSGEFERAMQALQVSMREGFLGVHARLDRVDGRLDRHSESIGKIESQQASHTTQLVHHDDQLRQIGRRSDRLSHVTVDAPQARVITLSLPLDPKTLAALMMAAAGIIAALWRLG